MRTNLAQGVASEASARADAHTNGATLRWRALLRGQSPSSLACLVPFAIAAAYVVVLFLRLPHILETIAWNSDVASAFTIPETLVRTGTAGHTVMASTGSYVPLWFGLMTASLPLHRELWEISATVAFLVAALAIGWSVSQVASRRAGALAVLLTIVASPPALSILMAAAYHNTVYLGTALLGAYLVWISRAHPRRRMTAFAVPLLAGVVLGVCLASDLLFLVTGIVPFAITAVLCGMQRDRRFQKIAISMFTSIVVALPCAWLTSKVMGSFGFVVVRPPTTIAPLSEIPRHSEYLFTGLKELFGGYLGDQQFPGLARSALGIACDVLMAAALLALLVLGTYTVVRLFRSTWRRHVKKPSTPDMALVLHVVYWTVSAASTAIAFELSVKANGVHAQYYTTLIFAVAAVIPLLMRPAFGNWLVLAGTSIFFLASLVGLVGADYSLTALGQAEPAIVRLARANHATTGYAGYWYASDLTWASHERVKVRPVSLCENPNPAGVDICPFYINRVPSWYVPARRRTFLLVNATEEYLYGVPNNLGHPLAVYALGGSTWMYIYPYDIASRLGQAAD
jgi:hypothetical protein